MLECWIRHSDGTRLFCRRWEIPAPRAIGFLVHGLGEHSGRYEHLARKLNERGLEVWALDQRGHGRSGGTRGDCRSVAQLAGDLHLQLLEAHLHYPDLQRLMIGHSLGGLIALTYAAEHPEMLRAVAVSSPALGLAQDPPPVKRILAEGLSRILPKTQIPNGVNPADLCRDPQVVEAYRQDPFVHRVITARCAVAIRDSMKEAFRLGSRLQIPCLILQAGKDKVCDPSASLRFATEVGKTTVTFRRYDELYHEVFNEPERDRVIQDLCGWMDEVLQ